MVRSRILPRFKWFWLTSRRRRNSGFTLLELLVSMIIGAIITVALLSLVVELTDANQKDLARSQTQQEMQAAMDYIAQELREAVYVYDGKCLEGNGTPNSTNYATTCPGLIKHIPASMTQNGTTPVLAFWRTDPLPDPVLKQCANQAFNSIDTFEIDGQRVPCRAGKSYTLVVYALVDNSVAPSPIWRGRARIERYQLSQFDSDGKAVAGYAPPLGTPQSKFIQWPYQAKVNVGSSIQVTNLQATRPSNSPAALVDFVDDSASTTQYCPDKLSRITPTDTAPFNPKKIRSFYACVNGETLDDQAAADQKSQLNVNQEILVFLQGSVAGRPGFPLNRSGVGESSSPDALNSDSTRVSPIQTRVLTRSAYGKNPS